MNCSFETSIALNDRPTTQNPSLYFAMSREEAFAGLPLGRLYLQQASRFIHQWCGSYERAEYLLRLRRRMAREDWLTLLGKHWSGCDNLGRYRTDFRRRLGTEGPLWALMTPEAAAAYRSLPNKVIIYRGCDRKWRSGMSWSLSREQACRFPFYARFRAETPVLVTAKVRKNHILGLILDRGEAEVITFHPERIKTEPLVQAHLPMPSLHSGRTLVAFWEDHSGGQEA